MILAGRSPDRPTRGDLLADLAAWAADYYPARAAPPPEALATAQLSAADLFLVFASTASIEAHLALVDQEPIRAAIDRARETAEWPALETLIKTRYAQHYAARARSAEDRRPLQKQPPAPLGILLRAG